MNGLTKLVFLCGDGGGGVRGGARTLRKCISPFNSPVYTGLTGADTRLSTRTLNKRCARWNLVSAFQHFISPPQRGTWPPAGGLSLKAVSAPWKGD